MGNASMALRVEPAPIRTGPHYALEVRPRECAEAIGARIQSLFRAAGTNPQDT